MHGSDFDDHIRPTINGLGKSRGSNHALDFIAVGLPLWFLLRLFKLPCASHPLNLYRYCLTSLFIMANGLADNMGNYERIVWRATSFLSTFLW